MPLGYLGYMKLGGIYLLTNSSGLNRKVEPIMSEAVWGAGWYNAAQHTNYADSQQNFEGDVSFELQGSSVIWNLFRDWLVEQRVYPKSVELSPNGITKHSYTASSGDPRSGCWLNSASFSVDAESLVTVSANLIALKRTETSSASSYKAINLGPGSPTNPLNPAPQNRNPFPGWSALTTVTWPGAPAIYSDANPTGFVLQKADFSVNNNTQVIRGCTGDSNPVAVLQGTIGVDGSITLWRDGPIPDPYDSTQTGSAFSASGASINIQFGVTSPLQFSVNHVLLNSDSYDIQGQNSPSVRVFGFAGLGDGLLPPFQMSAG